MLYKVNSVLPIYHLPSRTSASSIRNDDFKEQDKILTVPNLLCASRIVASPYIGYLIVQNEYSLALACFGYAGLSDFADDPLADKILVTCLFMSLTYAELIPSSLTCLIVSRDLLLIYAGLYIRYMAVSSPFTIQKYLDLRNPIAQIKPPMVSKANTLIQLTLIGAALASPVFGYTDHYTLKGLMGLTAATTFASALIKYRQNEYNKELDV
ncbi:CRLS [Lepeophtheirus salmonis]|uniref:cardiolipin synthase (CMP-forming) n=1 Tax=Lepeophtheirus salmonis TaxID=72036 RepID=A0A7R8H132_LEPSM|nr:CRLS [Lepeophtheirus salmonis]CAF2801298.1 CRLS [Lepeophtheirus salmonis]